MIRRVRHRRLVSRSTAGARLDSGREAAMLHTPHLSYGQGPTASFGRLSYVHGSGTRRRAGEAGEMLAALRGRGPQWGRLVLERTATAGLVTAAMMLGALAYGLGVGLPLSPAALAVEAALLFALLAVAFVGQLGWAYWNGDI